MIHFTMGRDDWAITIKGLKKPVFVAFNCCDLPGRPDQDAAPYKASIHKFKGSVPYKKGEEYSTWKDSVFIADNLRSLLICNRWLRKLFKTTPKTLYIAQGKFIR